MEGHSDGLVQIGSLFSQYSYTKKGKILNNRQELVKYFYDNARADWCSKRPLSPAYVASKLAHLSEFDLYAFKSQCEDRKRRGYPFGKYFWGALKARPTNAPKGI